MGRPPVQSRAEWLAATRARRAREARRYYESGPGGLLGRELHYELTAPDPCGIVTLADLARAIRPDSLDHVGTVRALERGEAA